MSTADDLVPGVPVVGLDPDGPVVLDGADRLGDAVSVRWRDRFGMERARLLFPPDVAGLQVVPRGAAVPALDADVGSFRRAFDAHRVRDAHLHAPYLALSAAAVEPLPHQVRAVYEEMVPRRPLRFLLADDPGAGKTIMAGLYVKELLARRAASRVVVVAPGSLVEQWQEELARRFGLAFTAFDRDLAVGAPHGNPFLAAPLLVVRIDQVARDAALLAQLSDGGWDLAVIDEAHKLTARYWGNKVLRSKRYEVGAALARASRHFLLMTATPHSGKEDDFRLFLALLDEDRFGGGGRADDDAAAVADLMRRLVKEQLRHLDGRPLFPERRASTVRYALTPLEAELYERVSDYVRHEMDKVAGDESRRTVGFALLVLQRRLASSPEAVLRSLQRRRDKLLAEAEALRAADSRLQEQLRASLQALDAVHEDEDDVRAEEREVLEEEAATGASASRSVADLEAEALLLADLVGLAQRVRDAGVDRKWEQLARLLTDARMHDEHGRRRKILVFTEHRDTLLYLEEKVVSLLQDRHAVVTISGSTPRAARRQVQDAFTTDPDVSVLLATDAAGEGVNLQVASLMVNYDLPWNPNRLEQRFGRIHRIGQREVCHLWNLVADGTREGDVFTTLLDKLATQREALGDQVFDVLGDVLSGADLHALLTDAIRYGDRADVRARLHARVDRVGSDLAVAAAQRRAHVSDLTPEHLREVRRTLALARADGLQPEVVEAFARDAMPQTRTEAVPLGDARLAVTRVPAELRSWDGAVGRQVQRRYDVVTFDPAALAVPGLPPAELLGPGHPLVDALADVVVARSADVLRRGTVLADPDSVGSYLLTLVRSAVREQETGDVLGQQLHALAVDEGGSVREVAARAFAHLPDGAAPPPAPDDLRTLLDAARTRAADVLGAAQEEEVAAAARAQRRTGLEEVRRRLGVQVAQVQAGIAAARTSGDEAAAADGEVALAALLHRLATREQAAQTDVALTRDEPEVVAVAWVQGTGSAEAVAALEAARDRAARALARSGRVDAALPHAGWDLLLTPPEGEPLFVVVHAEAGRALTSAEQHVASRVGAAHRLLVLPDDGAPGGDPWLVEAVGRS